MLQCMRQRGCVQQARNKQTNNSLHLSQQALCYSLLTIMHWNEIGTSAHFLFFPDCWFSWKCSIFESVTAFGTCVEGVEIVYNRSVQTLPPKSPPAWKSRGSGQCFGQLMIPLASNQPYICGPLPHVSGCLKWLLTQVQLSVRKACLLYLVTKATCLIWNWWWHVKRGPPDERAQ